MIIQCQACNTKFKVGDEKIKPPGIKVRCSKCGEVFFYEFSLEDENNEVNSSLLEQSSAIDSSLIDESSEVTNEITDKPEESVLQTGVTDQNEITDQKDSVPDEIDNTDHSDDTFSNIEVESIETVTQSDNEDDEMTQLSKEIMAAQIGTDISHDADVGNVNEAVNDIENDIPDELTQLVSEPKEPIMEVIDNTPPQNISEKSDLNPHPEPTGDRVNEGSDYRTTNLVVDQEALEQTYTKGTVASGQDASAYNIKSTSSSRSRRYPRKSRGGGFFKSLFKLLLTIVFLGALFFSSMFVLNEMKIYTNDYYTKLSPIVDRLIGENKKLALKNVKVIDKNGKWFNSKYGQVFVVSGDIINRSNEPINFVKLKVNYSSEGSKIFSQDIYAGNTLSNWEIKNRPFNTIQNKLLREKGDIIYEDINNLDGLNFDIQPGEEVPFYSVFPAQDKILGLKFRVEVLGYESQK
ncbi:MAG: zinc-ribbon domain-containing protein [Thermodesulfobacteriota bacterium]